MSLAGIGVSSGVGLGAGTSGESPTAPSSTDLAPEASAAVTEPERSDPLVGFTALAPVDVRAELVATLDSAVDLAVRPGDGALYVVEHAGRVVRVDGADSRVVADLRDRLAARLAALGG